VDSFAARLELARRARTGRLVAQRGGRLAGSASVDDARAGLAVAAARRAAERPDIRANATYPVRSHGFGPNDSPFEILIALAMILAIPLTVLAVSCANVANLQLARATTRARELAVRLAIGASRAQIVRLLVIEAAMLAMASTLAGWLGAAGAIAIAQAYFPLILTLDYRVLIFALALTTGVTLLSGLAPALIATRRSMAADLKHTHQGGGMAHRRLRHALVIVQVAASFVLLAGSSIFVRTSYAVQAGVPRAIEEQLVVAFDMDMLGYGPDDVGRVARGLRDRLRADPRVVAISLERDSSGRYGLPGDDLDSARHSNVKDVTPDWATVTDARVVAGRWLESGGAPDAVVVNERLARQIDPEGRVVGRRVVLRTSAQARQTLEIVGVIESQKRRVDDEQPDPVIYRLLPAVPPAGFDVRIRTRDNTALALDLRGIVESVEPRLPWARFWFGKDLYAGEFDAFRFMALAVGGFGALALLVAAGGLYAVMAYVVSLRQREFGIRIAIGARPEDLTAIVGRLALRLSGWGLAAGLVIAVPLAFVFRALMVGFSLSVTDPLSWLPVLAALAGVTVLAAIVPARRASRVDPMRVLRAE
jgi:predicted permease